jgi:hypothetical protein
MSDTATVQRYARYAGIAMLLSIVFGALGEAYLPGKIIVSGDATRTAANIVEHPTLFRMVFATYLVEGFCDIALCLFWYVVLKPVNRNIALLSAFVGIVSMITFAVAESCYFASSLIVKDTAGMSAFTVEQRNALALLSMRISSMIASLFLGFYGTATMLRGFLIMRSGYVPRVLGVLLMIGGAGFFLNCAAYILAPAYNSYLLLLPMAVAGIPTTFWLLFRGVDRLRVP